MAGKVIPREKTYQTKKYVGGFFFARFKQKPFEYYANVFFLLFFFQICLATSLWSCPLSAPGSVRWSVCCCITTRSGPSRSRSSASRRSSTSISGKKNKTHLQYVTICKKSCLGLVYTTYMTKPCDMGHMTV